MKRIIGTLGPSGTCSEEVACDYIHYQGWQLESSLQLFPTFEDAIGALFTERVDRVIVPAAYTRYNEIVFNNIDRLAVCEVLYSKTPAFLLAAQSGFQSQNNHRPLLACHRAPSPLLQKLDFDFEFLEVTSNAIAAQQLKEGQVDLCITNERALNVANSKLDSDQKLHVLQYFGSIEMVWIVFERKQNNALSSFWIGCIHDAISNPSVFEKTSDLVAA